MIIDGHLDLAWNALAYDRDQTWTIGQLRRREAAMPGSGRRGAAVSLPQMRQGQVAVSMASLLARSKPDARPTRCPDRTNIDYCSQAAAYAVAQGQLAYYQLLEQQGQLQIIRHVADLNAIWSRWQVRQADAPLPVGVVLTMEGADPIVCPEQARQWWDQGLRGLSLAHYGPSAYACGTPLGTGSRQRGLSQQGLELLKHCQSLGMMLDLTHASDRSFFEAIDLYRGPVYASHSNCRALVSGPRQLSDAQIRRIVQRGGVIGCVLEASMLCRSWKTGKTPRDAVGLSHVTDHLDHICQLAGDADHAAIGSDLDGGFGIQRCPHDLDTIADLSRLGPILSSRGFPDAAIADIFHGNWLRFLRTSLPNPT